MQSNLAEKFDCPEGDDLEGLSEEEQSLILALRDPVKGQKLRKVMEGSLNG